MPAAVYQAGTDLQYQVALMNGGVSCRVTVKDVMLGCSG